MSNLSLIAKGLKAHSEIKVEAKIYQLPFFESLWNVTDPTLLGQLRALFPSLLSVLHSISNHMQKILFSCKSRIEKRRRAKEEGWNQIKRSRRVLYPLYNCLS
jgi:hypothetical protein